MRIPVSWLVQQLELTEDYRDLSAQQVADAFVRVGMEVEEVSELGPVTGRVVVGRVAEIEELTEFKKPIRFCTVEIGEPEDPDDAEPETTQVICGATNFVEGDLVVVALPGAVLPGGFAISERKTYGRVSRGMICSARELGLGDEHAGILVLPTGEEAAPGDDAIELLGLTDSVIELSLTPDRGYCFSLRGLARELACALDVRLIDPAAIDVPVAEGESVPVTVTDPQACPRFVVRRVTGVDPTAPTPWWIRRRLMLAGIRSISLAVDITNYVMLELGQPMHAYDTGRLRGGLTIRRAEPGEKLVTLDDVERALDPDDILVCDESGPIGLAGVMGGASTEVRAESTDIVLEAAIWDPASIARAVRRHKLPSEASKRFERVVDPALPPAALERAARLLREYGEGSIHPGRTDVGNPTLPEPVVMPMDLPDRVAGIRYQRGVTVSRLQQIGCQVDIGTAEDGTPVVTAVPPSWRADLNQPADLVEEVLRLQGYETIPSVLPAAPAGSGLTAAQRRRRRVSRSLAEHGYVEVLPFPFVSGAVWDAFGLAPDDARRRTVKVLNPLEAERAELATTLLPGLLEAVSRNVSRGARDLSLFHIGQVVLPRAEQVPMPEVGVADRPSDADIATLKAALPNQPVHVAVVLTGNRQPPGWWGPGEPASWADAVQAARLVADAAGVELTVEKGDLPPWHPGRCARLSVGGFPVGHAGELHPKVVEALGLPQRTCAMELDLDLLPLVERRPVPSVSPYPPVLLDVALVVDAEVPAAELTRTLRGGGGDLLEDLSLFDVFTGEQIGEGKRSLAYSLRFRAPDRTLTVEEATAARDTAVAAAAERHGAALRG
ncbi:phenylalanine--tRNA ligase subunit beta [Actinokineospora iranica]|uniref:Phenylalanine--tRNA ligase beta subunit n=1 Tax=Actinokineospora iranica TaxID=1271860 RepID=A0A1G6JBZ2_9PSEU|nr:phenylalanine--tRNA ligase subunit beta [Actinokineospora iranica]SDC16199.1 phenylalanyl-tRNA synthetase beta subunit [Actinokineospora iranica]